MIDIPHDDNGSDKKLNDDEFTEFNEEMDGIIDQPYGMKIISMQVMPVHAYGKA